MNYLNKLITAPGDACTSAYRAIIDHPFIALAVSFGVGAIVGLVFGKNFVSVLDGALSLGIPIMWFLLGAYIMRHRQE